MVKTKLSTSMMRSESSEKRRYRYLNVSANTKLSIRSSFCIVRTSYHDDKPHFSQNLSYLACTYLDTGITAGDSGVTLKASKDFLAYMEVVGIQSSPIEEVGGLDKLRSEQMLSPVHLKIRRKGLWNEIVPLHDLVENLVTLNGRL